MTHFTELAPKHLTMYRKKTKLIILSITISVALITGIFSMLDAAQQFEKIQVIHDYGNYHLSILDATEEEMSIIKSRIDVENCGLWREIGEGTVKGVTCAFGALDKEFSENMNIKLIEGSYPIEGNELMVEKWASDKYKLDIKVNDIIKVQYKEDSIQKEIELKVSGIFNDLGNMKAQGVPGIFISAKAVKELNLASKSTLMIEMKKGIKVLEAEKEIIQSMNLSSARVARNERLLAVMGQSGHNAVTSMYWIGAVLFFIVLIAGIVMIYNTFNISVMERVRQFGLLRCIGASSVQIRQLVRREGLYLVIRAVPIGVLAGTLISLGCTVILKYYNRNLFGDISLFYFSLPGIGAGILIGLLSVFTASILPARKASRISPVNAVTGNTELKPRKKIKKGLLTKVLHIETAMGVNNAVLKKKTLLLMSCSIAISIIMFLGFQVFIDFMHSSLKTTKPYTADLAVRSEQGLDKDFIDKINRIDGVKRSYGVMFGYIDATFPADRLMDSYKKAMGGIKIKDDGTFDPPESSWLISYDKNQMKWAKGNLLEGTLDEEKINEMDGIIAVVITLRNNITSETAGLLLGDKVYINTPDGKKVKTVVGILRSTHYADDKLNMTTFITTEKQFTELTGQSSYNLINIQVKNRNQDSVAEEVRDLAGNALGFRDYRQNNSEIDQTFFTMALFVYGFISLIGLISILNIINTMNTSIAAKTRYLGVMRAVGMAGDQLNRMVLTEAATYCIIGSVTGCILGLLLQKTLIANMSSQLHVVWRFPAIQIVLILLLTLAVTLISIISPLKRIKSRGISEVVSAL